MTVTGSVDVAVAPKVLTVAASRRITRSMMATPRPPHYSSATLVGVVGSDDVTLVTSGASGAFSDENVGNGKTVTVSGLTLAGTDAGNYSLTQPTTTANITVLHITGTFTADNKVYDGNATATVLTRGLVGALGGDDVSLTGGTATSMTRPWPRQDGNAGRCKPDWC